MIDSLQANANHVTVGVVFLIVIAALLYRYRQTRVVRPFLLPFTKTRKRAGSVPYQNSQVPKDMMSENLLASGIIGSALPSPTNRNSQPYSMTSSDQQFIDGSQSRSLTEPKLSFQPKDDKSQPGLLRVVIPRETKLVLLRRQLDPSPLSAGFSIPPSPSGSPRVSVSSMHTTEVATSRPTSRASVGNLSVASSGVLSLRMMKWPVPPGTVRSPSPNDEPAAG